MFLSVADPDLQIKGGGGGDVGPRAPGRGGGGGGGGGEFGHSDPEIVGGGGWGGLQKNLFRPFGPHFGRKIRGVPGPSPRSATGC